MEDIFEYIVPIIIFIFWIIGNVFGGKKDEDEMPTPQRRPAPAEDDARAREIQEEIRRKIAERKQQQQQPNQQQPQRQPQVERNQPPPLAPVQQRQQAPASDEFDIRKRQQELLKAQREAERAQQETLARVAKMYGNQRKQESARKAQTAAVGLRHGDESLREAIRSSLQDPMSARKAFLFREIVGPPVALRDEGEMHPYGR